MQLQHLLGIHYLTAIKVQLFRATKSCKLCSGNLHHRQIKMYYLHLVGTQSDVSSRKGIMHLCFLAVDYDVGWLAEQHLSQEAFSYEAHISGLTRDTRLLPKKLDS